MKRALINPATNRVAEVIDTDERPEFPVAGPLMWVDCPEEASPETHVWDGMDVVPMPAPEAPPVVDLSILENNPGLLRLATAVAVATGASLDAIKAAFEAAE